MEILTYCDGETNKRVNNLSLDQRLLRFALTVLEERQEMEETSETARLFFMVGNIIRSSPRVY